MTDYDVVVGVDVGKSFHWLHATDQAGGTIRSHRIDQDESQLDAVFTALVVDHSVLVVVDQPNNIGALTVACALRAGCDVGYLPSLAMRRAADLLGGDAKTDRRDAEVIAWAGRSLSEVLRPVTSNPDREQLLALVAFDEECRDERTRHMNRLHSLLAEVNPGFEKALGTQVGSPFVLALLQRFGGPWGMRRAGRARIKRWVTTQQRVPHTLLDAVVAAAWSMEHQPAGADMHEQLAIPAAAARVAALTKTRADNEDRINTMLATNPTYQALLTMPGVGPKTAGALVTMVDITLFADHEKLASYAGVAARTRQSGTSVKSDTKSRHGNKTLKNTLFMSAFASLQRDPKALAFYQAKRAAGKHHNTAILALANKRLKIMYAIMRDNTPYRT